MTGEKGIFDSALKVDEHSKGNGAWWGLFALLVLGRLGLALWGEGPKGIYELILWASILMGMLALSSKGKWRENCLLLTGGLWTFLLLYNWLERGVELPYLPEHAISVGFPFVWAVWSRDAQKGVKFLTIALALTFLGHGLYALGWPEPQPDHFREMVRILLIEDWYDILFFLTLIGIIDVLAAGGLFAWKPIRKLSLIYALIWGTLTALARPMAYVHTETLIQDLLRWLPEMIIRLPHGGAAALLLFYQRSLSSDRETA